jgi:hypothetical protein
MAGQWFGGHTISCVSEEVARDKTSLQDRASSTITQLASLRLRLSCRVAGRLARK